MKLLLKRFIIPLEMIDKLVPNQGAIVDLGCGEGAITSFLSAKPKRAITGVDQNQQRLESAHQNQPHKKNLTYKHQDILKYSLPKNTAAVIISDVLHHLSKPNQTKLLTSISQSLKKNSLLVIKEIDSKDMLRSKLSRLWDFIFYPQDKINYLSKNQLINKLVQLNFKVTHIQTNKLVPASIHLYIAIKQ